MFNRKLNDRLNNILENDENIFDIDIRQEISNKLLKYQHLHVFNLLLALKSQNVVLDGSDTGTGKTYTSIAICKQLGLKPFIICPKVIMAKWKNVCRIFKVKPLMTVNYETIKIGKDYNDDKRTISKFIEKMDVSTDDKKNITYKWSLPRRSVIIFDEVHKCQNKNSLNGKLLLSTRNLRYTKVLMLSATIADNPKAFHSFGYMLRFYRNIKQGKNWISSVIREDRFSISNTNRKSSALYKNLYPSKGSRMDIEELGNEFPKNQVSADVYYLQKSKQINEICKTINHKILVNGSYHLVNLVRERQQLEKLKAPIFCELAQDYMENGHAVVIFVNFVDTVLLLGKMLHTKCLCFGKQSAEQNNRNINLFQQNKSNIIILTIKYGGESISLHDILGKPRASLISPIYSASTLKQILGRVWRVGSKSPVLQRIIYCADTLEEKICEKIQEKLQFLNKLSDKDLLIKF